MRARGPPASLYRGSRGSGPGGDVTDDHRVILSRGRPRWGLRRTTCERDTYTQQHSTISCHVKVRGWIKRGWTRRRPLQGPREDPQPRTSLLLHNATQEASFLNFRTRLCGLVEAFCVGNTTPAMSLTGGTPDKQSVGRQGEETNCQFSTIKGRR